MSSSQHAVAVALALALLAVACGSKSRTSTHPRSATVPVPTVRVGDCATPDQDGVHSDTPRMRRADRDLDGDGTPEAVVADVIQRMTDESESELMSEAIKVAFEETYIRPNGPLAFVNYRTVPDTHASELRRLTADVTVDGKSRAFHGLGNGPIDAYIHALKEEMGVDLTVVDYNEHAVSQGSDALAAAYVEARNAAGLTVFGVGLHKNIVQASLLAVTAAANRMQMAA
jgi:hypothetical protein